LNDVNETNKWRLFLYCSRVYLKCDMGIHSKDLLSLVSLDKVVSDLTNLDFLPIQRFTAPNGTVWHAFAVGDGESCWHEEPIVWEVFVAEVSVFVGDAPLFYVHGTLLSPGTFVQTEHEWTAALMLLLPDGESWTRMEEVD
jgi:hypothetical protein